MSEHSEDKHVAPDVLAAIGTPSTPRSWPTEAESGHRMKLNAIELITKGEIKSIDEAVERFKTRASAINAMCGIIADETQVVFMRMEKQFLQSCVKYFRQLEESKKDIKS